MTQTPQQKALQSLDEIAKGTLWDEDKWEVIAEHIPVIRQALTQAEEMQWMPIDSAPRDGTVVIVYRTEFKGYIPRIGEDYYKDNKWTHSNIYYQPTHWMPLPSPPTDLKEE